MVGRPGADPWFCLPVCVVTLLDAAVSLWFQPAAYWTDPARFREGNAAWAPLLAGGPVAFALAFLAYVVAVALIVLWLRGALQKFFGFFILLAHAYGAASWLHVELSDRSYWWALMGLFLVQAGSLAVCWHLRGRGARLCRTRC
jgi:hypothetical protein